MSSYGQALGRYSAARAICFGRHSSHSSSTLLEPVDRVGGHVETPALVAVFEPASFDAHPYRVGRATESCPRLLERQPARAVLVTEIVKAPIELAGQLGPAGERLPVTKTLASAATVPMLDVLRRELVAHRSRQAQRNLALVAPDALVFTT